MAIEWVEVESSNIGSIGHDGRNLYVRFKNDTVYKYADVAGSIVQEFVKSESKGKFLNANIKGKFEYKKIADVTKKEEQPEQEEKKDKDKEEKRTSINMMDMVNKKIKETTELMKRTFFKKPITVYYFTREVKSLDHTDVTLTSTKLKTLDDLAQFYKRVVPTLEEFHAQKEGENKVLLPGNMSLEYQLIHEIIEQCGMTEVREENGDQ